MRAKLQFAPLNNFPPDGPGPSRIAETLKERLLKLETEAKANPTASNRAALENCAAALESLALHDGKGAW